MPQQREPRDVLLFSPNTYLYILLLATDDLRGQWAVAVDFPRGSFYHSAR